MTRLCKLKGFNGFVGGKDNDGIFEEGVIYNVKVILGQIMLTPIGKQPEYDRHGEKISMLTLSEIITQGDYLCTEEEIKTIEY